MIDMPGPTAVPQGGRRRKKENSSMKSFGGKTIVITGAGSGMGRAYAIEFARRGAQLALNDYDADTLAETVALLPDATAALQSAFDVSDRDAMYRFADQVRSELGGAHVVINNAGVGGSGKSVWSSQDADYVHIMGINFYGVVHGTRAFLPQLRAHGEGAIVNVSSIFGLTGTPNSSDYCASKFAVRGFTESLMVEMVNEPITIHLVHPGGIATNIAKSAGADDFANKFLRTDPAEVATRVAESILKRRPRIVLGYGARKAQIGANFLPRTILTRMLWKQIGPTIDKSDYPA
jgi:NAD(P)-dependent dehydrogenase (short-subunit alcohol dehydrogenase family)